MIKIAKSRFWLERLLCSSGAETFKFVECFTNLAYTKLFSFIDDDHVRCQCVNIISHFSKFAVFAKSKLTVVRVVSALLEAWICLCMY